MNDNSVELIKQVVGVTEKVSPDDPEEVAKAKQVLAKHFRSKLSNIASDDNNGNLSRTTNPSNCDACGAPIMCYRVSGLGYMCLQCGFAWDGKSLLTKTENGEETQ